MQEIVSRGRALPTAAPRQRKSIASYREQLERLASLPPCERAIPRANRKTAYPPRRMPVRAASPVLAPRLASATPRRPRPHTRAQPRAHTYPHRLAPQSAEPRRTGPRRRSNLHTHWPASHIQSGRSTASPTSCRTSNLTRAVRSARTWASLLSTLGAAPAYGRAAGDDQHAWGAASQRPQGRAPRRRAR